MRSPKPGCAGPVAFSSEAARGPSSHSGFEPQRIRSVSGSHSQAMTCAVSAAMRSNSALCRSASRVFARSLFWSESETRVAMVMAQSRSCALHVRGAPMCSMCSTPARRSPSTTGTSRIAPISSCARNAPANSAVRGSVLTFPASMISPVSSVVKYVGRAPARITDPPEWRAGPDSNRSSQWTADRSASNSQMLARAARQ